MLMTHLPEAHGMQLDAVSGAGFRLADTQSAVARQAGFGSWPVLCRHIQQLRALEGTWSFVTLETDGRAAAKELLRRSRLLIDGDRFRMAVARGDLRGRLHH